MSAGLFMGVRQPFSVCVIPSQGESETAKDIARTQNCLKMRFLDLLEMFLLETNDMFDGPSSYKKNQDSSV